MLELCDVELSWDFQHLFHILSFFPHILALGTWIRVLNAIFFCIQVILFSYSVQTSCSSLSILCIWRALVAPFLLLGLLRCQKCFPNEVSGSLHLEQYSFNADTRGGGLRKFLQGKGTHFAFFCWEGFCFALTLHLKPHPKQHMLALKGLAFL